MLDRLELPLMTPHNQDQLRTAYTISVDARDGVTTGISAADRAHTVRVLADSATEPRGPDPARARVPAARRARAACWSGPATPRPPSTWPGSPGSSPAGVIGELVNDDGTMTRLAGACATSATSTTCR